MRIASAQASAASSRAALSVQVVQFAGRVEQAAGFQRLGGDAVRIGHVAAGEVAFGRAASRRTFPAARR